MFVVERRRSVARRFSFVALLLLGACFARRAAADAVVRWSPSTDTTVVGYDVYVRGAGNPYSTARRAGLPTLAADGTYSYRATQLPAAATLYFAVAGYRADGTESTLSNEVAVGPTDSCQLDRCYSVSSCFILPLPDGTQCADATTDPCASTCSRGSCGAALRAALETDRITVVQSTHGLRLGALGLLPADPSTDVASSGVSVNIDPIGGAPVFDAYVPGDAFTVSRTATAFRYRAPKGVKTGLLLLTMRKASGRFRVSVRAVVSDVTVTDLPTDLRWMLNADGQCASTSGLTCSRGTGSLTCF